MKKLVFLLVCVFTVSTVAMADNEKPIQVGQLPTKAQTFHHYLLQRPQGSFGKTGQRFVQQIIRCDFHQRRKD